MIKRYGMPRSSSKSNRRSTGSQPSAVKTPPETVSGRWLVKAIAAVILLALLCSYGSLMFLYHLGQWQIVLHPATATHSAPPKGLIHFGPDESGRSQLTGEWIAAESGSRYAALTVLLLPSGDGSRIDAQPVVDALHQIGLNVFIFDYRGYGSSAVIHPSQQRMTEDAEAAWRYLTATRGIPGTAVLPYGIGVGSSLAAHLAKIHKEIPAMILDAPHTDLLEFARADRRSHYLPTWFLFSERFPLAQPLTGLATPKLLISRKKEEAASFTGAATPKMEVELPDGSDATLYRQSVTRFLDQYLTSVIHQ